jgi:hypothetical protein
MDRPHPGDRDTEVDKGAVAHPPPVPPATPGPHALGEDACLVTTGTELLCGRPHSREIGDHGVRFATHIPVLLAHRINRYLFDTIDYATDMAMAILDASIRSIFSSNLSDANHTIDSVGDLETVTDGITATALQKKGELALPIGYVAESICQAGEYGADSSETIINRLIDEERSPRL